MKIPIITIVLLAIGSTGLQAQTPTTAASQGNVPPPTDYQIVQQDGNSRVWQREIYEQEPNGRIVARPHQFTELATGLNYKDANGQWQPSKEEIDLQPDGTLAATQGQHQVYFPGNIYGGEIELVQPNGVQLHSSPVGLSYDDSSNTVLIAVLTNSVGQLIGSNQVIYTNAFVGLDADLLYTYTKAGLEQDVVLREQPPTPASLGLNPDTTRLQVLTEFFDPPQPSQTTSTLPEQAGLALTDDTLNFGTMQMIPGKAFKLGEDSPSARVGKSWVSLQGRQFLVEAVPVAALAEQLDGLPAPSAQTASTAKARVVSRNLMLPPQHLAKGVQPLKLARTGISRKPGVVLDYLTVNSSLTNYTFQGSTTYFISGSANLYGTNTFEGGTVIKYASGASIYTESRCQLNWEASAYRPVVFTAKDDNSVGDAISGSTGNPSGYYAQCALNFYQNTCPLSNFRISYAEQAIQAAYSSVNSFYDGQIIDCQNGIEIYTDTVLLRNLLFANVQTNLNTINNGTIDAQNVTFSGGSSLAPYVANGSLSLENCILADVAALTNYMSTATISGTNNGFYDSPEFGSGAVTNNFYPFQTVGGGKYYLTNGCAFHNAGTNNIDPTLLADLATKTTWPPIAYTNVTFSSATNFSPQAQRDYTGIPDLGYHYDPIDYSFGGCHADANFTFTPGTVVGWFRTSSGWSEAGYGINMGAGVTLLFSGTATAPDYWVRLNTVQEQDYTAGYGQAGIETWVNSDLPTVSGQFLRCSAMAGELRSYFSDDGGSIQAHMVDCEFWGGSLCAYGDYMYFTNCLMQRVNMQLWNGNTTSARIAWDCTFFGGDFDIERVDGGPTLVSVRNSSFDGTSISTSDYYGSNPTYSDYDYNAYTNSVDPFSIGGANDVKGTSFNWESSWFGNYYLPTNSPLILKGSTTANLLGLYHFTTQTNQTVEGDSIVDIGYHYVATDDNGDPLDSNGDGIPDYLEDPLGNGLPYDGTNWALAILVQPVSQTVTQGSNVTMSVTADGVPTLGYQWYWDGAPLSDAGGVFGSRSATLTLDGVMSDQAGNYSVVVSNSFGSITSIIATLTVIPSQTYDTLPLYVMPPYGYWNVTDISDPAQPVNIGELQEPFTEPWYYDSDNSVLPMNAPWHTNASVIVNEAYGTAVHGGVFNNGTVFQISTVGPAGNQPNELVLSGNTLYGTTAGPGENPNNLNYGTIFSISTNGSGYTNLYEFAGGSDGANPRAGLVLSDNMLYGTTYSGGANGMGTVFSFNITNGAFTTLYSFAGEFGNPLDDGANPSAKLVLSGNMLYGTTVNGGAYGYGTVFEINTDVPSEQIIHSFAGQPYNDGDTPMAALSLSGGILYGTTEWGGTHDKGTVFGISTNGGAVNILHNFDDDDGINPLSGLMIYGGTAYGTTYSGGTNGGGGTVFAINTNNDSFSVLHSFNPDITNDAANPYATLVLSGSTLYGTASAGGNIDYGTVFSISTNGTSFTNLYSFQDNTDGQSPEAALMLSGNALFGTALGNPDFPGNPNFGAIFSINTNGSDFTVLDSYFTTEFAVIHNFSGLDGAYPCSPLALSGSTFYGISNTLYGTTSGGGTNGCGTVFKVNADGTGFTNLYEFTGGTDGANPQAGPVISGNTLYGTTTNTIYKINTDGSDYTCLTNIYGASQLILSLSGYTLFGTISNGGFYGYGMVFSINTDGSDLTDLYNFTGGTGGAFPNAGLELLGLPNLIATGSTTNVLYGTTSGGGANGDGMAFSINTDGSRFVDLHDFNETNDGANPEAGLLLYTNTFVTLTITPYAQLYGTTFNGGTNGGGTAFSMNLDGSDFKTLYSFGAVAGSGIHPEGKLVFVGQQALYGTTSGGGVYTNGTVFSINTNGSEFADCYDFRGDYGVVGLTLPVVDSEISIWSLDTSLNLSASDLSNIDYSIAIDNFYALFVNGNIVSYTNHQNWAQWSAYTSLPYLHQGENDIRVVIAGGGVTDYFTMAAKSTASGVVFTNRVFGTAYEGGNGNGTIYEITSGGNETNLYSFSGQHDGANPIGDLVSSDGLLYGVTQNGGSNGYGTVFRFSIGSTNDVILYNFGSTNNDGQAPGAGLVLVSNTLYGTTSSGGSNNEGTIFSISTNGSNYRVLYSFGSANNDGGNPQAGLLYASNMLYGTTFSDGANNAGTIFRINTDGSRYTNLYSFIGQPVDGSDPQAKLLLASNTLYGTTSGGGSSGCGTVFSFGIDSTNDTVLYNFTNTPDGANPDAGLLLASNILYGTTYYGGSNGFGTVFSFSIGNTNDTILHSFSTYDGNNPEAALIIQGSSLYGTTFNGGANGYGNLFGISTNGADFNDIYDFIGNPDGANPKGGLCSP